MPHQPVTRSGIPAISSSSKEERESVAARRQFWTVDELNKKSRYSKREIEQMVESKLSQYHLSHVSRLVPHGSGEFYSKLPRRMILGEDYTNLILPSLDLQSSIYHGSY